MTSAIKLKITAEIVEKEPEPNMTKHGETLKYHKAFNSIRECVFPHVFWIELDKSWSRASSCSIAKVNYS